METKTSSPNLGAVASVRGSVVEVRFDGPLPPIYSVLRAGTENKIVIEVLAQSDARHARGIALMPTQGLARGMVVRVHPELLLNQALSEPLHDEKNLWEERYGSIVDLERHLHRNGPKIIKFFLHLSKDEQTLKRQRELQSIRKSLEK